MKTALITGASAGLGSDFAKLFAKDGHSLILVARRRDKLEQLAAEIKTRHAHLRVDVIDMDLGEPGAGDKLFQKVRALGVEIHFLVNNAGFGICGPFSNLPLANQLKMLDLNMRTLMELTYLFLPEMLDRKSGRILNVGSMAGFQPGPYMSAYFATKAFVNSLSEALHEELRGSGVTCTVLAPGATATEFAEVSGAGNALIFKGTSVASSDEVAQIGYEAMMAGRALVVAGALNNVLVQSLRLSPRALIRKIAARLNRV